jgi:hypothetical protein
MKLYYSAAVRRALARPEHYVRRAYFAATVVALVSFGAWIGYNFALWRVHA